MKNEKGFTLIELVATLVIIAIVVSITIPLVLNIIRKSKQSVLRRSVDGYGCCIRISTFNRY